MALHLNISNVLSQLAVRMSLVLRQQQFNVFLPQYIVTQTEGMNSWLKLQIADQNGIAANYLFVSPNEIIQKVYYFLGGEFPNTLSAQNLGWLLYSILGENDFKRRFSQVASYYNHEGFDRDLKRMALAEKTADLFDQYQIYRPEWIENWNTGDTFDIPADNWQQYLWARAKQLSQERLPDKTVIGKYIREALKDPDKRERLKSKLPALHLFGLSIITDYHLDLLFRVSEICEVHFHLVNPAPNVYWFEDRSEKQLAFLKMKGWMDKSEQDSGNTLLTSWGKVIQDTFMMLFRNEDLFNRYDDVGIEEPGTDTLLHKIQNDIFNGSSRQERNPVLATDISDGSVRISSCYTITREVEVLYNYLVHLVDQQKEKLSPRDIVVMVTDIDAYAPYIKAVFKNAPYSFHFTIADESYVHGDTLLRALTAILDMNRENFRAEEVLQLLDAAYIRRRFGITDLELVRKAVDSANIRFGMNGASKDDTRFVSWEYGIKRLMYGICISGEDEYTDPEGESLFPLDMTEGAETHEIIRFCHFVQVLMDSIKERENQRTIAEWVDYTERVIQNLVSQPDEEADEAQVLLQKQLKALLMAGDFMEEKISFEIFTHSLYRAVSSAGRSGSFAGGGITFCSLIPMRSIPFKVVALLGLNLDKFPRRESAASFNLLENDKRRRGDRNVKDNDKHLFLDTILSAKDYLYISYIGQNVKDNTTFPPSALVDELVDYIESPCLEPETARAALITRHPLHSFSRKLMPGFWNYLDTGKKGLVFTPDENKSPEQFSFDEITIEGLISFLNHPVKGYYNKVFSIYYEDDDVLLEDTELFELDTLQEWTIKPQLLSLKKSGKDAFQNRLVKTGRLPLRNMAGVALDEIENKIAAVRELFVSCTGDVQEAKQTVELKIDNSIIKGTLKNIYQGKLVIVSYSKNENRYLLEAYVRYLVAMASGYNCSLIFISASKEAIFRGSPLSAGEAFRRLEVLVHLYKQGHSKMLPYFHKFKITPTMIEELDEETLSKELDAVFRNNASSTDQYLRNEYENGFFHSADFMQRYKAVAEVLVKPLAEIFAGYYAP